MLQFKTLIIMKKILFVLAFVFGTLYSNNISAQDYNSAIGLRLGSPIAASYKTFLNEAGAIELFVGFRSHGIIGFRSNSVYFGGLYQHHFDIPAVEGLRWYIGGGVAGQLYSYSFTNTTDFYLNIALNGGAEYTFADIPLALSVDYVPLIGIIGGGGFYGGWASFNARYILNR